MASLSSARNYTTYGDTTGGAAGIDGQSVEAFDRKVKDNLYNTVEPNVLGELLSQSRA